MENTDSNENVVRDVIGEKQRMLWKVTKEKLTESRVSGYTS